MTKRPQLVALVLLLPVLLLPLRAHASSAPVVDLLDLVVDPVTGSRSIAELAVGETVDVHAVVDALSATTIYSYQFAIEVDPSLTVLDVTLPTTTSFVTSPVPSQVVVGLSSPLLVAQGPHVLATWRILRVAAATPDTPAFVRLTDLPDGGTPQYAAPGPAFHVADFVDPGPLLIGDVAPQLQSFLPSEPVVVSGREYALAWEGVGITDVTLDGTPVDATGTSSRTALADASHVLAWNENGVARSATVDVAVVERPRVVRMEVEDPQGSNADLFRVTWEVQGASGVWWDPGNEFVAVRGTRNVSASEPTPVTLRAENEWGTTFATVVLASDGSPQIGAFRTDVTGLDLGESTTLRWSVADAQRVVLEPLGLDVDPVGEITVTPDSTTTYRLVASGAGPDAVAERTISVDLLRIQFFDVSPDELQWGDPLRISWNVNAADSLWIEPDVGPLSSLAGSLEIVPTVEQAYTLFARRGSAERSELRDWSFLLPYASLTVGSLTPRPTVPLTVHTALADSARLDPGGIMVSTFAQGVRYDLPRLQTQGEYVLTAWNGAGSTQAVLEWTNRAPEFTLTDLTPVGLPRLDLLGMPWRVHVSLRWATSGTYQYPTDALPRPIDLPEDEFGDFRGTISETFWLDEPGFIRLVAENDAHVLVDSIPIGQGLPRVVTLDADRTEIQAGESVTLHWSMPPEVPGAHEIRGATLYPLGVEIGLVGSLEVTPDATTQYVIHARSYYGRHYVIRAVETVRVMSGATSMLALPMQPRPGEEFTLELTLPDDALSATLEPGIGAIAAQSQSLVHTIDGDVEFALRVDRPGGTETAYLQVQTVPEEEIVTRVAPTPPVTRFRALPNVPNPFNPSTTIRFATTRSGALRVQIFDARGRTVRTTDLGRRDAGTQGWVWDGRADDGSAVASGTYLVRVSGPEGAVTQKVTLAK